LMKWITENIFGSVENVDSWGIFAVHKTVEWGCIAICWLLYTLEIPFIEKWKAYPTPWPWKDPNPEVRKEFSALNKRALIFVLKFHAVITVITFLLTFLPKFRIEKADWRYTPDWKESTFQIAVSMIFADAGHYWGHRLLHTPQFYRWHKMHHEFKQNTVLAGFYISWVELLLTVIFPAGIGMLLFDMHIYTFWLYSVPLELSAVWGHCGYSWYKMFNPFQALPFSTEIELTHDIHHRGLKDGQYWNYGGGYYIWDKLAKTYLDPFSDKEYLSDYAAYMQTFDANEYLGNKKVD